MGLLTAWSIWAGTALAEVTLATSVQKVALDETGLQGERLLDADSVLPGETLRYTIVFSNDSTQDVAAGSIVITNPLPEGTEYLAGSAAGPDTEISFSVDGENFAAAEQLRVQEAGTARPALAADYRSIRWTFKPRLAAGESSRVSFDLRIP